MALRADAAGVATAEGASSAGAFGGAGLAVVAVPAPAPADVAAIPVGAESDPTLIANRF
jgi:hypothetical protein